MHLQGDDSISADRFEKAGNITRRYRIIWLGAAILSSIAKIRRNRRDPLCAGVPKCADEEKQSAQLIVGACYPGRRGDSEPHKHLIRGRLAQDVPCARRLRIPAPREAPVRVQERAQWLCQESALSLRANRRMLAPSDRRGLAPHGDQKCCSITMAWNLIECAGASFSGMRLIGPHGVGPRRMLVHGWPRG